MTVFNAIVGRSFDLLMWPLLPLPPLASLAVVSLLTGVGILLVLRATSNQAAIAVRKRLIYAAILELILFNDDWRAILRAQLDVLRHNAAYLGLWLVPLAWMTVPMALEIAQLQSRYGYDGLYIGQPALVSVRSNNRLANGAAFTLEVPTSVRVETAAVWFPESAQTVWRVSPVSAGDSPVTVHAGGQTYTKTLAASRAVTRRSPTREKAGLLSQFQNPAETPLPSDASIDSIAVDYPARTLELFGWRMGWLAWFFLMSAGFALILSRRLGVAL